MDSKRIQPHYNVGDKLTVIDSVNKESEAVVMDVQVKDNQLKLFIHYVGWMDKSAQHSHSALKHKPMLRREQEPKLTSSTVSYSSVSGGPR